MTKKKYQRYNSEFKSLALRRASEDGVTDKEVCDDLNDPFREQQTFSLRYSIQDRKVTSCC